MSQLPENPPRSPLRRLFAAARASMTPRPVEGVHCPRCRGDFMAPIEWEPSDEQHWRIVERCGQCELWRAITLTNAQAALLDVRLDRQQAAIASAIDRLDHARMAIEVEAFATALQRDLICAEDFAGGQRA